MAYSAKKHCFNKQYNLNKKAADHSAAFLWSCISEIRTSKRLSTQIQTNYLSSFQRL